MKGFVLIAILSALFLISCAALDNVPPTIQTLRFSKIPKNAGEPVVIELIAVDQSGISRIYVYNGDEKIYSTTRTGEISFPAPYGTVSLRVVVIDKNGNASSKTLSAFKTEDVKAPSVEIEYTPKGVVPGETISIVVTAVDAESGVRKTGLRINGSEVTLENGKYSLLASPGVYELVAYAIDNAGNQATKEETITVSTPGDESGPTIEFVGLPKKLQPNSQVNILMNISDESGILSITFDDGIETTYRPSGATTEITWNITRNVGSQNPYSFIVVAEDSKGNSSQVTETISIGENLPPSVIIDVDNPTPVEGEDVVISLEVTDDSKVTQIALYIDNSPVRTFTSEPYTYTWRTVKGLHKIKAIATDDSGEQTEAYYTINVGVQDTEPPTIYFSSPYGVTFGESYTFYAFVTDNVQVDSVSFSFSGPENIGPIEANTVGGGIYSISETFSATGTYTVNVVARDISDNSSAQQGQFPVDEDYIVRAPRIKEFSFSPSAVNQGETVHFKVVADDDLSLSRCDFYINGVKYMSTEPTVGTFEWDWTATILGSHEIDVVVFDTEGFSDSATGTVNVLSERPIAQILQPEDEYRTPYAENMSLSLIAQVLDSSSPTVAYFEITGPYDTRINVEASGDGPVYSFSSDWKVEGPGEYTINFYYTNEINLSDSTSVTVTVLDLGVVFNEPLPGQLHQCGTELYVEARVSNYVEGDCQIKVKRGDNEVYSTTATITNLPGDYNIYSTTIPATANVFNTPDTYTITLTGNTSEGEEAKGSTFIIVVDTTPPEITSVKLNNKEEIAENETYLVAMDENPTLSVEAKDNRGIKSIDIQRKTNGIYTTIHSEKASSLSYDIPQKYLEPFENYFRIVATDLDENKSYLPFVIYVYETNPPTFTQFRSMSINPSSDVYNLNAWVWIQIRGDYNNYTQFIVQDDSGIKEVRLRIFGVGYDEIIDKLYEHKEEEPVETEKFISNDDIGFSLPTVPGSYTIVLEAVDVFDNTTSIAEINIQVEDLIPPIVSIEVEEESIEKTTSDGIPVLRNPADIIVNFLDNTEPIKSVELLFTDSSGKTQLIGKRDDLAGDTCTFDNVSLSEYSDGLGVLTAYATTTSESTGSQSLKVIVDNESDPKVIISMPAAGSYDGKRCYSGTILLNAVVENIDDIDVRWIELYIDETITSTITNPAVNGFTFSIDTTSYSEGEHTLSLVVADMAENTSNKDSITARETVIFDNTPPDLIWDSHGVYTSDTDITFTIDEPFGISEAKLTTAWGTVDPVSQDGTSVTFEHGISSDEKSGFSLMVADTAGNASYFTGTLYHDNTPPTVTVTAPANVITELGDSFELSYSDNLTSVAKLYMYKDGNLENSWDVPWLEEATTIFWVPEDDYEGTVNIEFEVNDMVGLTAADTVSVDVDTKDPDITALEITPSGTEVVVLHNGIYYTNTENPQVNWTITDINFDHAKLIVGSAAPILVGENGSQVIGITEGSTTTVKLEAYDSVNHSESDSFKVIRDTTSPVIENVVFGSTPVTENSTITTSPGIINLSFEVDETFINLDETYIEFGGSQMDVSSTTFDGTWKFSVSLTVGASTTILIHTEDLATNSDEFSFGVEIQ